jgi:hypothetical protein
MTVGIWNLEFGIWNLKYWNLKYWNLNSYESI